MKRLLVLSLLVILTVLFSAPAQTADLTERRMLGTQRDDGSYRLLLNQGECNESGCVLFEGRTTGAEWVHQWMDTNNDHTCDYVKVWRPIDDPTFGRFYELIRNKGCSI